MEHCLTNSQAGVCLARKRGYRFDTRNRCMIRNTRCSHLLLVLSPQRAKYAKCPHKDVSGKWRSYSPLHDAYATPCVVLNEAANWCTHIRNDRRRGLRRVRRHEVACAHATVCIPLNMYVCMYVCSKYI